MLLAVDREELQRAATPEQMSAALAEYPDDLGRLHDVHAHPGMSMRDVAYNGHNIHIVTTYEIDVDGVPITGHLLVNNEGKVHYHAIPNEEFASTVDLVKRIVDLSPGGLGAPPNPPPNPPVNQNPGHSHGH